MSTPELPPDTEDRGAQTPADARRHELASSEPWTASPKMPRPRQTRRLRLPALRMIGVATGAAAVLGWRIRARADAIRASEALSSAASASVSTFVPALAEA
jgi:hypothetical protein